MGVVKGDQMVLNIGPQHPSTHGVLRLEVMTDGDILKMLPMNKLFHLPIDVTI